MCSINRAAPQPFLIIDSSAHLPVLEPCAVSHRKSASPAVMERLFGILVTHHWKETLHFPSDLDRLLCLQLFSWSFLLQNSNSFCDLPKTFPLKTSPQLHVVNTFLVVSVCAKYHSQFLPVPLWNGFPPAVVTLL